MKEKALPELQIDEEFRTLIRPLTSKEFRQLEQNLLRDGCMDPIVTWNGIIVDGHNRYKICKKHEIPFEVIEIDFRSKAEAIIWICDQQLGRRNISDETRKFLIGTQYSAEKMILKNPKGVNQYYPYNRDEHAEEEKGNQQKSAGTQYIHVTAKRIADEHHISSGTVSKYAQYAQAIEEIRKKAPSVLPLILSGSVKISHKNTVRLSKMEPNQIQIIIDRLKKQSESYVQYKNSRKEIETGTEESSVLAWPAGPSIKDMPPYDPDAEATALTLTIPTWSDSLVRARKQIDLSTVSERARNRMSEALLKLTETAEEFLKAVQEE